MITPHVRSLLASTVRAACASVVIIGATVVLGWVFDLAPFTGLVAGFPAMKMNAAWGVIGAACGLWLLRDDERRGVAGPLCALAVLALGLTAMAESIWNRDFGVDDLFIGGVEADANLGRIELATSIMLTLTSAGLLLLWRRRVAAAQWLAVAVAFMCVFSLQAWIHSALDLYYIPVFSAVGIATIAVFMLLSVGILAARGDQGIVAVFVGSRPGGLMSRRVWLPLIVLVLVMGTLVEWLQRSGTLESGADTAILVLWISILSSLLIWFNARSLNRLDDELRLTIDERVSAEQTLRRQASLFDQLRENERATRETLRSNEERLALALEINQTGAWDLDVGQNQVRRSVEHDRIFGYETLQPVWTFDTFVSHVVPEERDRIRRRFSKTFQSSVDDWSFDCRIRRVDGAVRWIAVRGRSRRNSRGEIEVLSGVVQDVTERKDIEEEILRLNADLEGRVERRTQELEVANQELEAFSYSVSHDLRAPLRTVDGFSQAVLEDFGAELPAEAQRYLKIVRDGAQRMGRLIDDLLTFSRLSRQLLTTRPVDMHMLACHAWQEVAAERQNQNADIRIDQLPGSFGDPALLKQVWLNLLSNALKYSRERTPPRVHVGHVREGDEDVYFVRDNGTGFDMQYAHKLFRVFQRLHRSEDFEGTGVGLAVVQRIVHRHGGRIWAEAVVDEGATFHFTLVAKDSRDPQPSR